MPEILKSWADWKPNHLVEDTLVDNRCENLEAYIEWALSNTPSDKYRAAINRLYSWCYTYAEFIDGIDLVMFNTRFKRVTEAYLKRKSVESKEVNEDGLQQRK